MIFIRKSNILLVTIITVLLITGCSKGNDAVASDLSRTNPSFQFLLMGNTVPKLMEQLLMLQQAAFSRMKVFVY